MKHSSFEAFGQDAIPVEELPTVVGGIDNEGHIQMDEDEHTLEIEDELVQK